jgi:hypothetical protein
MNHLKCTFPFIFSLLFISHGYGQTVISGTVKDKDNKPLPGANVFLTGTYDGVSSEPDGSFSFTTDEEGEGTLTASFMGFKTWSRIVTLDGKDKFFEIILEEESTQLGAVIVSAGSFEASDENKAVLLRPLDILTTGAEADIYSTLETLPGTQKIGETDGLFVRGGSASETKTVIDEMVVQNPFYSSVPDVPSRGRFTPTLFKGTVFSTGGYSAQYGQALSSVLVLRSQDLAPKTQTSINLMLLGVGGSHVQRWENTSLSFEGGYYNLHPHFAVQKQKTDWKKAPESIESAVNFRQKISKNGMLKAFAAFSYGDMSLYMPDLNNLSRKDFIYQKSGNLFFNTSYRDIIGDDWTVFAGYTYSNDDEDNEINTDIAGRKDDFHTGKLSITKGLFSNTFLTFGGEIQYLNSTSTFNELEGILKETGTAGFIETDVIFTNDIAAKIGIRAEHSEVLNKNNIAPRVSLAYRLGTFDQLNFAYGHFYQTPAPDMLLQYRDFEFEKATHYILNYQYLDFSRTFRIEAYYKDYDKLAKGTVYTYPYFNLPLVPMSNAGSGYAKGIDIFWRDKESLGLAEYWISYSYLDTKRNFRNYPVMAAPTFSTPHTFSLVAKSWIQDITSLISLTYSFATGRPYFNPNNPDVLFLDDYTKGYHNLSLNASYVTSLFGNFTVAFFSVDNILGINNIYTYRYSDDGKVKAPVHAPALRNAFFGLFISLGESNPY